MFDGVAKHYDRTNSVLSMGNSIIWRVATVRAVAAQTGERILDIAAGTGTSSAALARSGADVVAADFSAGMIEVGRHKHPNLTFVEADAMALPFEDGEFDAVTISFGLRNIEDPKLALSEMYRVLKPDGTVDRIATAERLDAHRLIEECMILANVAAAETLEKKALPLIYRVHDEPTVEKVHNLKEFLKTLDMPFSATGALRPAVFNRILMQVKGRDAEPLVNEVVLRSQAQAEYSADNYGHFGLNLRRYAHFTSPIRRYADLIVHRALIRALGLGEGALPETESFETLSEVAAAISLTERRAMKAERETADRLIAHHLADRIGATFTGRISGVTRAGLFVKLNETGADGLIPVRTLGTEYYNYDETRHALIGSRSGAMHRLGDVVEVRLVEAAPVAGALRFELLSEGVTAPRGGLMREGRRSSKPQFPRTEGKARPGRDKKKSRKPSRKARKSKKG